MKKVSAFSVFKSKKDKGDTPRVLNDSIDSDKGSIKRASSTPSIAEASKHIKGKKVLRVLKGGSLRSSMKTTPRKRPSILKAAEDVATDGGSVKLTSVKSNSSIKSTSKKTDKRSDDTPKIPPRGVKPRKDATVGLPPKAKPATSPKLKTSPKHKIADLSNSEDKSKGKSTKSPIKQASPKPQAKVLPNGKFSPRTNRENLEPQTPIESLNAQVTSNLSSPKTGHKVKSPKFGGNTDTAVSVGSAKMKSPKTGNKRPLDQSDNEPNKKKRVEKQDCTPGDITQPSFDEDGDQFNDSSLPYMYDSGDEARKIFECVIHPVKPDKFFKELWERKPLLVKRHLVQYNDGWFSTAELDKILREENIQFGVNLDVTTFTNGKRETHNPVGRAYAPVVWDYYQNGCSVRLLNPQTYSRNVWKLLSVLQEYFNCCVGANVYLTPAGTQGFAPHYDDIEAFILQLEGKKHWRLYSPRTDAETLPRTSSGNFTDEGLGEPILEVVLEPGDLLYFPRGTIHQGKCMEDVHSLHITVSCYQKNTWGDLFEKLIPRALQMAVEEDVEFRKGLPRDYLNYMGIANSEVESPQRKAFLRKIEHLMVKLMGYAPVDASCDQMGKDFVHNSLPPVLSEMEKLCSINGGGEKWDAEKKCVTGNVEIEPDTQVKIIRKGVIRLLTEEDQVRIYYSLENSRLYHAVEPQYLEISAELAPAVEYLLHSYPEYVRVETFPLATIDQKVDVATSLYEKGILITSEPLEPLDGSPTEEMDNT